MCAHDAHDFNYNYIGVIMVETNPIPKYQSLADFATELRESVFESLLAAANYFNLHRATIGRYENNRIAPPVGYLACLAQLLAEQNRKDQQTDKVWLDTLLKEINQAIWDNRVIYGAKKRLRSWEELLQVASDYQSRRFQEKTDKHPEVLPETVNPRIKEKQQGTNNHTTSYDEELARFFTNAEELQTLFMHLLTAPKPKKRILVIHGITGVGKSSLLRMFRLHSKNAHVPVGLVSASDAKSPIDILNAWVVDLRANELEFSAYLNSLEHYRTIYTGVYEQRHAFVLSEGKSEAAPRVEVAGDLVSSFRPSSNPLSQIGAEVLVSWLREFFAQPDFDLLLDPVKKLTHNFLTDLAKIAYRRRVVLMLDTYEQMLLFSNWLHYLVERLPDNVLLVIASRVIPVWAEGGFLAQTEVHRLEPMTTEEMDTLIRRYYATIKTDEPDSSQIKAITGLAQGLPLVVTTAVRLWAKYEVTDLEEVKPELLGELVKRLRQGVPRDLVPLVDAAAVVRWFNQSILRGATGLTDVDTAYEDLISFPFVRSTRKGFSVHDAIRKILDENLRMQDRERYHLLHEQAALYFVTEMKKERVGIDEREDFRLEWLYHTVCADEKEGLRLFQEIAEELVRYRLVNRLRTLLNDANTYSLEYVNSRLWREYYQARMAELEDLFADAEKIYQTISENPLAEPKLRAYALCDWGVLLGLRNRLLSGGKVAEEQAISAITRSLGYGVDDKLIGNYWTLGDIYRRVGQWEPALSAYQKTLDFLEQHEDQYLVPYLKGKLAANLGYFGYFSNALTIYVDIWRLLKSDKAVNSFQDLSVDLIEAMAIPLIWMGNYAQTRERLETVLPSLNKLQRQRGDFWLFERRWQIARTLGYLAGLEGKVEESIRHFETSLKFVKENIRLWRSERIDQSEGTILGFYGASLLKCGELNKSEEFLLKSLTVKRRVNDLSGIPELLVWLGEVQEIKHTQIANKNRSLELSVAESYHRQALDLRGVGRLYYECAALVGLIRVKYAQADYSTIPPLWAEAIQLAQQYEYNDHMAALQLIQGHLVWNGLSPAMDDQVFDSALQYYQSALIYALRYNRFVLDEVLFGRVQGSPLPSIIPHCLTHGDDGRKMLVKLREWWMSGKNDVGVARPDTISLIPENISLLKAERIARQHEPGNDSLQKTVIEQLEAALT
jgi:tetratricopeptide (TPR) repeat protein